MTRQRIYRDRVYFVAVRRGISGFERWNEYDHGIASGATVQLHRRLVEDPAGHVAQFGNLNAGERFRLADGHFPEHQPRATYDAACRWVLANPGRIAYILGEAES